MKSRTKKYNCIDCGEDLFYPDWQIRQKNKRGYTDIRCKSCASKKKWADRSEEENSKILHKLSEGRSDWLSKQSKEALSERSKHAGEGNRNNNGLSAIRQWETIKANEELFNKAKVRLRKISVDRWSSMSDADKENHFKKVFKKLPVSKAANLFLRTVLAEGISFYEEYFIKGYFVDALVKDTNVVLEFFGDMFHCNPLDFEDTSLYCSWISRTVGEQWVRDIKRVNSIIKPGYTVIIIWEKEWNSSPETVLERIKDEVSKSRKSKQ